MSKEQRAAENRAIACGRVNDGYVEFGEPRGGGSCSREEQRQVVRCVPVLQSEKQVAAVYGVGEDGKRIPFDQLHASVREVREVQVIQYDHNGRPISKEFKPH